MSWQFEEDQSQPISSKDVAEYARRRGLSENQIGGLVSNIQAESAFKPDTLVNDSGQPAGGLFQHRGDRFSALQKQVPDWKTNWQKQIDFALSEPEGQKYLQQKFESPQAASKWFTENFERPANTKAEAAKRAGGGESGAKSQWVMEDESAKLPSFESVISHPDYTKASEQQKYAIRKSYFQEYAKNNPDFLNLPPEQRQKVAEGIIYAGVPPPAKPSIMEPIKGTAKEAGRMATAIAGPFLGAAAGTATMGPGLGTAIGASLGGATTEGLAEYFFDGKVAPRQIALMGVLGMLPGFEFGGVTSPLGRVAVRAGEGAVVGAASTGASKLVEGEMPSAGELAKGAGMGAAFGAVMGGREGRPAEAAKEAAPTATPTLQPPEQARVQAISQEMQGAAAQAQTPAGKQQLASELAGHVVQTEQARALERAQGIFAKDLAGNKPIRPQDIQNAKTLWNQMSPELKDSYMQKAMGQARGKGRAAPATQPKPAEAKAAPAQPTVDPVFSLVKSAIQKQIKNEPLTRQEIDALSRYGPPAATARKPLVAKPEERAKAQLRVADRQAADQSAINDARMILADPNAAEPTKAAARAKLQELGVAQAAPAAAAEMAPRTPEEAAREAETTKVLQEGLKTQKPVGVPEGPMTAQERAQQAKIRPVTKPKPTPEASLSPYEQEVLAQSRAEFGGKKAKAPPRVVDDSEAAVSTIIKREGGINIPKNLKEEFGGSNRLHNKKGMAPDEWATELFNRGKLPEPTTAALLDSLKGGSGKTARVGSAETAAKLEMESAASAVVDQLHGTEEPLKFKGKTYEGATKEPGGNLRLKDAPDKVLKKADDILQVERAEPEGLPWERPGAAAEAKVPAVKVGDEIQTGRTHAEAAEKTAGGLEAYLKAKEQGGATEGFANAEGKNFEEQAKTEAPRFEPTEAGMQGVIPGTPQRQIAQTATGAKVAQAREPTALERAAEPPATEKQGTILDILKSERGSVELPDVTEQYEKAKKLVTNFRNTYDHLRVSAGTRAAMAYTKDAGDNAAALFSRQMANDFRGPIRRVFGTDAVKAEQALSFVIEANNRPDNLRKFKEQILNSPDTSAAWKKKLPEVIDFARDNWDSLKVLAKRYQTVTDMQIVNEHANGIATPRRAGGYVMHVHDIPDEGIGFMARGGDGEPTGFRHIRTHQTFADALAAGLDPKTVNAVDLLQARLNRGQRMIANKVWVDGLRGMTDPRSGAPVVTNASIQRRADGSVDVAAPEGYSMQRIGFQPVAIKNGYEGTFSALTNPSLFSKSMMGRGFVESNAAGKSINLLFDTFHLARVAYWESLIKGLGISSFKTPLPSYKKGVTLLDYTPTEITRMANAGEIPKEWVPGLHEELRKTDLAVKTGYNVGRISDALHQDLIQNVKGIGTYNKWLFDQFQRGAMREVWSLEYDRLKAARPDMSDLEAARRISSDLNTRFGNLGRQGVFKSRTAQDAARAFALAPQWNEGLIRSELGAVRQLGEFGVDAAKGRSIYSGVLLRSVGGMALGQFAANQLINYATRGTPTWENPEEGFGAKVSAWIPDVIGGGPGFFLHPLGLAAETTHLIMQGYERTDDWHKTLMSYLKSRSSAAMRPILTFLTNQDFLGRTLKPGTVWGEMVKSAIPTPIPSSALVGAGKQIVSGEPGETFPGQFQKQLMASVGIKTEQAPGPEQRMQRLARQYNTERGVTPGAQFYASDFEDLSGALRMKNQTDAKAALDELLKKKTPQAIMRHYSQWAFHPFTGSTAHEAGFLKTLSPEQRQQYQAAQQTRRDIAKRAIQLMRERPGGLRGMIIGKKQEPNQPEMVR